MLLKSEDILHVAVQLCEQFNPPYQVSSIEQDDDSWVLLSDEMFKCLERENVQLFLDKLLRANSRIVPGDITSDVLMAHLCMVAPKLPIDLVPVLESGLNGQIETIEELKSKLNHALELNKDRQMHSKMDRLHWDIGYDTHIGRRKSWFSQTNQDNFFFATHDQVALMMVADGISTSTAGTGDLASKIASHIVQKFWDDNKHRYIEWNGEEIQAHLYEIMEMINYNICEIAKTQTENPIKQEIPMGTTMVIGIAKGSEVWMANLGDSRIYGILESGLAQITGDQNVRGTRLRFHQPWKGHRDNAALVGHLGRFVPNDSGEWIDDMPHPDFFHINLLPGEALLFCSDGVTDYLSSNYHETHAILADVCNDRDPMDICADLTHRANKGGGGDNITSVFARLCTID